MLQNCSLYGDSNSPSFHENVFNESTEAATRGAL